MGNRIVRSKESPIRKGLSWEARWLGSDHGLIACWEAGRILRDESPELAERAEAGELPLMSWKGGVEKSKDLKLKKKHGCYFYLAQWQGLRNEDLDIDISKETEILCSATGVRVIFTKNARKYGGVLTFGATRPVDGDMISAGGLCAE